MVAARRPTVGTLLARFTKTVSFPRSLLSFPEIRARRRYPWPNAARTGVRRDRMAIRCPRSAPGGALAGYAAHPFDRAVRTDDDHRAGPTAPAHGRFVRRHRRLAAGARRLRPTHPSPRSPRRHHAQDGAVGGGGRAAATTRGVPGAAEIGTERPGSRRSGRPPRLRHRRPQAAPAGPRGANPPTVIRATHRRQRRGRDRPGRHPHRRRERSTPHAAAAGRRPRLWRVDGRARTPGASATGRLRTAAGDPLQVRGRPACARRGDPRSARSRADRDRAQT